MIIPLNKNSTMKAGRTIVAKLVAKSVTEAKMGWFMKMSYTKEKIGKYIKRPASNNFVGL